MVPMTTLYDGRFHHAGPHEPSAATPPKWVLPFAAAVLRTPQVTSPLISLNSETARYSTVSSANTDRIVLG